DERLLAEIEKLIKRQLPVERLDVDGGAHERPARREPREARERRDGPSEARRRSGGAPRKPAAPARPVDPLFSQPYVPQERPAKEAASQEGNATSRSGSLRKSRRPLAALL